MIAPLITLTEVGFRYRKDLPPALAAVTCSIAPGVVGLIGANGAGKTTLLQLLTGAAEPSVGSVRIGGLDPHAFRRSRGLGAIPDQPRFPAHLTVHEFLDGLRLAVGSPPRTDAERALHDALDIGTLHHRRLRELSLGQGRRVELLAALIGDPDLVTLDEPTNGLDPVAVYALRKGILASRREGRLILVSSHHLDELQRVADHVLILHEGRLVGNHDAAAVAASATSFEDLFLQAGEPRGR